MKHRELEFEYVDGELIRADLRYIEENRPLLVFCHGFKGFKNWGFYPHLTESFVKRGYNTLVFNFSLNGVGDDLLNFTVLEKFKENTFTREIEELRFVLGKILSGGVLPFSKIALVGHSRGGSSVLNVASEFSEVEAVSTLASICRMRFPQPDHEKDWRQRGVTHIMNMRTGQKMPLGVPLLDDMYQHKDRLENAVRSLEKPLLIVHGDNDPTVELEEAESLHAWAKNSRLEVVEGGDHVFNIKHPWAGTSEELEKVIGLVDEFFKRELNL